jgi:hypothetical protein
MIIEIAGWVAAVLAGTGGCWLGIHAADRINDWRARRRMAKDHERALGDRPVRDDLGAAGRALDR